MGPPCPRPGWRACHARLAEGPRNTRIACSANYVDGLMHAAVLSFAMAALANAVIPNLDAGDRSCGLTRSPGHPRAACQAVDISAQAERRTQAALGTRERGSRPRNLAAQPIRRARLCT